MTTIIDAHLIGIATDQHTLALVVTMEDAQLHTDAHPFCSDLVCPCHATIDSTAGGVPAYYAEYIHDPYQAGLLSREEIERIYHGDHL